MSINNNRVVIEGHSIVSEDGRIADARGEMPSALRNEADWSLFQAALNRAALVVLGRLGHERHPNPGRRRLVLTRRVKDVSADPRDQNATLWNPAGMDLETVLGRLRISDGVVAVTGGTETFERFLPLYDRFVLSEVRGLQIPDGRPCFSQGRPQLVLEAAGLTARETQVIDSEAGVVQTVWLRPPEI